MKKNLSTSYSFIEKQLHELVLSNSVVKKALIYIERLFFLRKDENLHLSNRHIFITGLARSGTTILLKNLHATNNFASLTYKDMPFVLAPNLWKLLNNGFHNDIEYERPHGDGIKNSVKSPEAFDEVFFKSFDTLSLTGKYYQEYIALVLKRYNKKRYLCKNNANFLRLNKILPLYPNALFFVTFRKPTHHANSLLLQHLNFINIHEKDKFVKKYMNWLGHNEFGSCYQPCFQENLEYQDSMDINHWLEQWLKAYSYIYENFIKHNQVKFQSYESLCDIETDWKDICNLSEVQNQEPKYKFVNSNKKLSNINFTYDNSLLSKCEMLYKKMSNKS